MDLTLYNNYWLVPAKCGSRHIDKLLDIKTQLNTQFPLDWDSFIIDTENHNKIMIPSEHIFHYWKLPITHIILREPMDLLQAALHTDISGHHKNLIKDGGGFISTNLELREWLLEYTTFGTGHWSPTLYKGLWYLFQMRPNIQIVPLRDLTRFLAKNGIVGATGAYTSSDYNFSKSGPSRTDIINSIKIVFPEIWSRILNAIEEETKYYDYICDRKILELPKIKKIRKKVRLI